MGDQSLPDSEEQKVVRKGQKGPKVSGAEGEKCTWIKLMGSFKCSDVHCKVLWETQQRKVGGQKKRKEKKKQSLAWGDRWQRFKSRQEKGDGLTTTARTQMIKFSSCVKEHRVMRGNGRNSPFLGWTSGSMVGPWNQIRNTGRCSHSRFFEGASYLPNTLSIPRAFHYLKKIPRQGKRMANKTEWQTGQWPIISPQTLPCKALRS